MNRFRCEAFRTTTLKRLANSEVNIAALNRHQGCLLERDYGRTDLRRLADNAESLSFSTPTEYDLSTGADVVRDIAIRDAERRPRGEDQD